MSLKQVRRPTATATAGDGQRPTYTSAQEIETWVEALKFYDNNEFDEALACFDNVSDTSKILFNMGVINATLGQHEQAVRAPFAAPPCTVLTLLA